jgi:cytochrome oxidase assembly protein ShyY1
MPDEPMNQSVDDVVRERERALDESIAASLESQPDLAMLIPVDFAARVAAQVPSKRPAVVTTKTHYGRSAMWVSLAVLLVAFVVAAVRGAEHSPVGAAVVLTLYMQFLAIAVWLGIRRWRAS